MHLAHSDADALDFACRLSVAALPDFRWAGVSLTGTVEPFTAAASDPRACTVQQAQYDLGDGPCLRAVRHDRTITLRIDEIAVRWPDLARAAKSAGIGSTVAVPLHTRDAVLGSLNLYGSYPAYGFTVPPATLALLTSYFERVLASDGTELKRLSGSQLRRAMGHREIVEQARGVLMATSGLDRREAGDRLQQLAERGRCSLVAAARSVLRRHQIQTGRSDTRGARQAP